MMLCDFCGQAKECVQKEIDGREFDICADCWRPLEEKLKGKGRVRRKRETVFLPPRTVPEPEEPKTPPGLPPTIWGGADRLNKAGGDVTTAADRRDRSVFQPVYRQTLSPKTSSFRDIGVGPAPRL